MSSAVPTVPQIRPTWTPAPPARFACDPAASRGRVHREPESATRSPFQRDRDRIIHSGAFRKLKHKTQVFLYHEGDYYRTRLTHSIEVAQIARSIARTLGLDEDLAEALALAHDLGHTPFGHAGEDALAESMNPYGGFEHNDQTLRILTRLERRYASFDGLNLTWETLEGIVKHNGPILPLAPGKRLPTTLAAFSQDVDLALDTYPSAEAQVAALSDDIAYNTHDLDDGIRAGLFTIEELAEVPLVGPIIAEVRTLYAGLDPGRTVNETTRRLIDRMVVDLIGETRRRLGILDPKSADDIRRAGQPVVAFSERLREPVRALRSFLWHRMYRDYRVNRMTSKARIIVRDLFRRFMEEPDCLPPDWHPAEGVDDLARARLIADYIAGMTDRYAIVEHERLFDLHAKR